MSEKRVAIYSTKAGGDIRVDCRECIQGPNGYEDNCTRAVDGGTCFGGTLIDNLVFKEMRDE